MSIESLGFHTHTLAEKCEKLAFVIKEITRLEKVIEELREDEESLTESLIEETNTSVLVIQNGRSWDCIDLREGTVTPTKVITPSGKN